MILSLLVLGFFSLNATEPSFLLHVNGDGKVLVKATQSEIRVGIEVEGKTSNGVQNELSEKMNRLIEQLKKEKIETSSFAVYPEYSSQTPPQIKGYRGNAEVKITAPIEQTGALISLAMNSGATKVNGIDLSASQDEINAAGQSAIKEACANALASAKTTLIALDLEMDEIVEVNLRQNEPSVRPFRNFAAFASDAKAIQGPSVEGEQIIESRVSLQIRFKPH